MTDPIPEPAAPAPVPPAPDGRRWYVVGLQVANTWLTMDLLCLGDAEAAAIGSTVAAALYPRVAAFAVRERDGRPVCEVATATLIAKIDGEVTKRVGGPSSGSSILVASDTKAFEKFAEAHRQRTEERMKGGQ